MGHSENCSSSPNSPALSRARKSLPEMQSSTDPKSPALSTKNRRSFRSSGRSSLTNTSCTSPTSTSPSSTPFGSPSARSSLRSSFNKGSPTPGRKLTTPQGPNLATAGRKRTCKCSETHHHGHHGHVTPVVPRVPLERERASRRSRGSNIAADDLKARARSQPPRASDSSRDSSSVRNSPVRDSPEREPPISSPRESPASDSDTDAVLEVAPAPLARVRPVPPPKPAEKKGSVTTMVNWVPWLAEKRYYTTLRVTPRTCPVITAVTAAPTLRRGSGQVGEQQQQHHFKVIHSSSSSLVQPSFTTAIGAPPGAIVARLTMA